MSGNTIGSIVGGIVGAAFGVPQLGFVIGGAIGGYIDPVKIKGPRLTDAQQQTSQEGIPIPFGYGTFPCAGNVIWAGPLVETEQKSGGKGGPQQISYTYSRSYAIGICEGEISGIQQIKRNGKLVYDISPTSTILGNNSKFLANATIYTGSETQLVDSVIEAVVGVGNTAPYRGLAYIVFEDDDLTDTQGAIAQYDFVVQKCGTVTDLNADRITFIATGDVDEVRTAVPDGTWTDRTSGLSGVALKFLAIAGDTVVGCTSANQFYYSLDRGVSWTISTTGPFGGGSSQVHGIAAGQGFFVAVTDDTVIRSLDGGFTWVETAAGYATAAGIAYGEGTFVVVSGDGIWTSPTGATWTNVDAAALLAVAYNGSYFMAVGDSGDSYSSPSGSTWTYGSSPGGVSFSFITVTGQDGYFIAGANTLAGIYKTTDLGVTWVAKQTAGSSTASASGEGIDVVTSASTAYFSYDQGETWVNHQPPVPVEDLVYAAPDSSWYVVPDAPNTYADQDGNVITDYVLGTQISACSAVLSDIVADLCERAGIDSTEYDVTELTDTLAGFKCATESTAQAFMMPLGEAFFFDPAEWDKKLRFIKRGGASAFALTADDMVAQDGPSIQVTQIQEVELLRKVDVVYIDPANGYANGKQSAERRVSTIQAMGESVVELPIVLDADTAAGVADKKIKVGWSEMDKYGFGLTVEWAKLTPTDVGTLTDKTGKVNRVRLMSQNEEAGVFTIEEAVKDRASTYGSTATGVTNPNNPVVTPGLVGPTLFAAMNLPLLRSQDNSPGFYIGATGILDGWAGCQILMSVDGGLTYTVAATITEPTIMGTLTADEDSNGEPISVHVFGGDLVNADTAQVAVGANWSAIETAGVAEIIAYEVATETTPNYYDLTTVTRALDDTSAAFHLSGDQFMDLNTAIFLPMNADLSGTTIYFKAVGFGVSADAVDAIPVLFTAQDIILDGGLIT